MSGRCQVSDALPSLRCGVGGDAMRNMLRLTAAFALLYGAATTVVAQPKGERATIKGEVVDMWCYLEGGDRGPAKKECATACAKAGNPIAIVDAKGNLYVVASLKDH